MSMSDCPEILAAASWWKIILFGRQVMDTGDAKTNEAMNSLLSNHPWNKPTPEQANSFEEALIALMAVKYKKTWKPENPNFGSANRILSVDYGPDHLLSCALTFANVIGTLALPIKTTMWVNPREVKVRVGYGNEEKIIYKGKI